MSNSTISMSMNGVNSGKSTSMESPATTEKLTTVTTSDHSTITTTSGVISTEPTLNTTTATTTNDVHDAAETTTEYTVTSTTTTTTTTTNPVVISTTLTTTSITRAIEPSENMITSSITPTSSYSIPTNTLTTCLTSSCSQQQERKGLSNSGMIGIIIGSISLFLVVTLGLYVCFKRRKSKENDEEEKRKSHMSRASQFLYHQKETNIIEEPTMNTVPYYSSYNHDYVPPTALFPRRESTPQILVQEEHRSGDNSSIDLDRDNYTYSAMDIFSTGTRRRNEGMCYCPSLNESVLLGNNSQY